MNPSTKELLEKIIDESQHQIVPPLGKYERQCCTIVALRFAREMCEKAFDAGVNFGSDNLLLPTEPNISQWLKENFE